MSALTQIKALRPVCYLNQFVSHSEKSASDVSERRDPGKTNRVAFEIRMNLSALSAASSLNKIIIAQNCSAVMTVFDLDTPHLNSGSTSEVSGATKPNSSWSQTQLTRPIVALVEAGSKKGARQPGDIISERRATSSRNQRATSSESANSANSLLYVR